MSHTYEVEIKSLLGSKENSKALLSKLKKNDKNLKLFEKNKQLNHYFNVPEHVDLKSLIKLIGKTKEEAFHKIIDEGKKLSVRTREINGKKVILVIKASIGDDTSSNGVKRIEFESEVNTTLDKLDKALLKAGLSYQAKWSREREEYVSKGIHICIDKNAGYGYLAEFEKVVKDEKKLEKTKTDLLLFMKKMNVEELPQDRLERMFKHYNENWNKYYGTEKTFIIR